MAASGIVLEPLTRDNYENWSALVKNYLTSQGLWDVIESQSNGKSEGNNEDRKRTAKALHIIQLACGSEVLPRIRDLETAKEAWNKLKSFYNPELPVEPDIEQGVGDNSRLHKLFHRYVKSGQWKYAIEIINKDNNALFSTSSLGRTVLHFAVMAGNQSMVDKLVRLGKEKLLKMQDKSEYSALALAAELTGNTMVAKCMVEKKGGLDLLTMKTKNNEIPVLLSAAKGYKEMTRYLYSQTDDISVFEDQNCHYGILLLTRCITAEIFDVALSLIHRIRCSPIANGESDGLRPLYALARMPSVFLSGCRFGPVQRFIYNILIVDRDETECKLRKEETNKLGKEETKPQMTHSKSQRIMPGDATQIEDHRSTVFGGERHDIEGKPRLKPQMTHPIRQLPDDTQIEDLCGTFFEGITEIFEHKKTHVRVGEILISLCERLSECRESHPLGDSALEAMFLAAKHGITEYIDAMMKVDPDVLWATDENGRGIFAHAIMNRRKGVFELVKKEGHMETIKCGEDVFGNNLLHLAGCLGPSSDLHRTSGAALQMQRELQWFKAVEKIVHPDCKAWENIDGKKPSEIFSESHEEMVKAGEKWAKDTASSFTLVATLITTIMFAVAFTVPGGNHQETGVPLYLHDHIFTFFIIADAVSLFTSSTSVLLFIGILTSRYAEKDFLKTLPLKLLFGLVALFLSVVAMVGAFCASLAMMLKGYRLLVIATMTLGCIPVTVLVPSQLRLFLEIFNSTTRKF